MIEDYNYTPCGWRLVKRHTAFDDDADNDGAADGTDNTACLATQDPGGACDPGFNAASTNTIVRNRPCSATGNDLGFMSATAARA